jgi:hypothetical protein
MTFEEVRSALKTGKKITQEFCLSYDTGYYLFLEKGDFPKDQGEFSNDKIKAMTKKSGIIKAKFVPHDFLRDDWVVIT